MLKGTNNKIIASIITKLELTVLIFGSWRIDEFSIKRFISATKTRKHQISLKINTDYVYFVEFSVLEIYWQVIHINPFYTGLIDY